MKALPATAAAAALLWTLAAASAAPVQPPRWYGHFIGDVLQQRIELRGADGRPLELASLPEPTRVDAWLERRPARLEPGGVLVLEYQIVNSPPQARRVSLPALRLAARTGASVIDVPAWPLSIAPLAADDPSAPAPLQPLRPAPSRDERPALRDLRHSGAALLGTLLLWAACVACWRWRDRTRRPFARAARELRGLRPDAPEAWRTLHRAFDGCAGRALHRGHLAPLFAAAPWLAPLHADIERFYGDSATLFYGGVAPAEPAWPRTLLKQLLRLERRHAAP